MPTTINPCIARTDLACLPLLKARPLVAYSGLASSPPLQASQPVKRLESQVKRLESRVAPQTSVTGPTVQVDSTLSLLPSLLQPSAPFLFITFNDDFFDTEAFHKAFSPEFQRNVYFTLSKNDPTGDEVNVFYRYLYATSKELLNKDCDNNSIDKKIRQISESFSYEDIYHFNQAITKNQNKMSEIVSKKRYVSI